MTLDDYNGVVHDDRLIGAVTTTFWHLALRNGWKIIEIYEADGNCLCDTGSRRRTREEGFVADDA